jgi:hypothetical protein
VDVHQHQVRRLALGLDQRGSAVVGETDAMARALQQRCQVLAVDRMVFGDQHVQRAGQVPAIGRVGGG